MFAVSQVQILAAGMYITSDTDNRTECECNQLVATVGYYQKTCIPSSVRTTPVLATYTTSLH